MEQLPYVVSADIYLLLQRWAKEKHFLLPDEEFFARLRLDFIRSLKQIFPQVELVPENELRQGLGRLLAGSIYPVVSLDPVYYASSYSLEVTRTVGTNNEDIGLQNRSGAKSLNEQIAALKNAGLTKVILTDDVIFSGSLLSSIINMLEAVGIEVVSIYAGIGIGAGIRKLEDSGFAVSCVKTYDQVIDQVCERDFYPGIPLSGRLLTDSKFSVPYILPFGDPIKWASIPEPDQIYFSRFCWENTRTLFEEIEDISKKLVFCSDLSRLVKTLPVNGVRYVYAINRVIEKMV